MWTLGIDVGKRRHVATLLNEAGQSVFRDHGFAQSRAGVDGLLARLAQAQAPPEAVLVGLEATGHYWQILFQTLVEAGLQVMVVNPLVTAARRNITIRGHKTDAVDADLIARVLREDQVPCSAVPPPEVQALRDLTRLRFECAQQAVAEKQRVIGLLDLVFPEYSTHFSDLFGATSREVLAHFPTAEALAKVDVRRLTRLLKAASKGQLGRAKADQLKQAARHTFALQGRTETLALEMRFVVERLNLLLEQIDDLDRRLSGWLVQQQALLRSIPGLGPVWAPTLLAELLPMFHPEEKDGAKKLVAAAGVDVRQVESGQWKGKSKMSKRGSKYFRTAIMQAAEVAVGRAKDPMFRAIYQRQIERGKHHTVAVSHVANKMLHVIFSVLKNERPYRPILT